MANVTITGLSPAAALTGTEVLAIDQSGSTVKTTVQDVANLASGGGGLSLPTVSVTPAIPSYTTQKYYVPAVISINGATTDSTKYGYSFNALGEGATGIYYTDNKITALSTTATVIDTIPVFNLDPTFTTLSLPTVEVFIETNGFLGILNIPPFSQLTSLSFANLKLLGTVTVQGSLINTLSFPSLLSVNNNLYISSIATDTPISFPALQVINQSLDVINFQSDTISFPNLVYIGNNLNLSLSAGANPQTLNLNSLQTIFGTYVNIQMSNLTSFALPSLKYISNGCNIYFYTALDQTSVDNVLVALAALDGTNGTFIWSVGTINISGGNAAPGATGVTAKDVLIARGISVSTN